MQIYANFVNFWLSDLLLNLILSLFLSIIVSKKLFCVDAAYQVLHVVV